MRIRDRLADPPKRRCEECRRCLKLGLAGRRVEGLREEVERLGGATFFEGRFREPRQMGALAGEIARRGSAQHADRLLVLEALRVEAKNSLKSLQSLVVPAASEIGNAEVIERLFEVGCDCGGSSQCFDGTTALPELQTAQSEQVPALGGLFDLQAAFEIGDGVEMSSFEHVARAERKVREKCVGSHLLRSGESLFGLVPLSEIRRNRTQVDEGLKLGTSQLQDLAKGDARSFKLTAVKCGLADERPKLVAVRCHRRELGEEIAHDLGVRSDEGELERSELVTECGVRVARVGCLGENPVGVGLESSGEITGEEFLIGGPLPAVDHLGAGDDPLRLEEPAERLDSGVGNRQVVLQLCQVLGRGCVAHRPPAR